MLRVIRDERMVCNTCADLKRRLHMNFEEPIVCTIIRLSGKTDLEAEILMP